MLKGFNADLGCLVFEGIDMSIAAIFVEENVI